MIPRTIALPGQVWGLAAPGADGPVFVTSYDGKNLDRTVLSTVDLKGQVLWQHTVDGHPSAPRVSEHGTVWLAHGRTLTELTAAGDVVRHVDLEHEPHEHLGAFVVLPDGFCVAWLPAGRARVVPSGCFPRVARHAEDGTAEWSAPITLGSVSHPGVIQMSVDNDGQPLPKPAWRPRTIVVANWQPLLVSGDRVVASYTDYSSGITVSFFFDTTTGALVAITPPAAGGMAAIVAPGEFLLGEQGYGSFGSTRYDRAGAVVQRWSSHGMMLVDQDGDIRGVEYENVLPSRSLFRGLGTDGSLRDGPLLSGYYTTYPALDQDGTAVFWRDGRLLAVDADFQVRELFVMPDERGVMNRALLLDGHLMFTLGDELLIFRDTGLGPLNDGVWPCADGNLRGNPVLGVS